MESVVTRNIDVLGFIFYFFKLGQQQSSEGPEIPNGLGVITHNDVRLLTYQCIDN